MAAAQAQLQSAVAAGDQDALDAALAAGADATVVLPKYNGFWDDFNLIHVAVIERHAHLIAPLQAAGANVNHTDSILGCTPLMLAGFRGNLQCVEQLVACGADLEARDKDGQETPLMMAARNNKLSCVNALLAAGADPLAYNSGGQMALDMARKHKDQQVVDRLQEDPRVSHYEILKSAVTTGDKDALAAALAAGADATAVLPKYKDMSDVILIGVAVMEGHAHLIAPLQAAGADATVVLSKYKCLPDVNLIGVAVIEGHVDIISPLHAAGADAKVVLPEYKGVTDVNLIGVAVMEDQAHLIAPLQAAGADAKVVLSKYKGLPNINLIGVAVIEGYADLIAPLKAAGADATVVLPEYKGLANVNFIGVAVIEGHAELISPLQAAGADDTVVLPEYKGNIFGNLIGVAVMKGHAHLIARLQAAGADINQPDEDGFTPVHYAVMHGYTQCLEKLLKCKADLEPRTKMKQHTPLMLAVHHDQDECLRPLLMAGADYSTIDLPSLLHKSAKGGRFETLMFIIERGLIDPDTPDEDSITPLEWAQMKGHRVISDWLRKLPRQQREPLSELDKLSLLDQCRSNYENLGKAMISRNWAQVREDEDSNYRDEKGWTYLHTRAAEGDNYDVESLLGKYQVTSNVITYNGSTPSDVAEAAGHHKLAKHLRQPIPREHSIAVAIAEKLLEKYNNSQHEEHVEILDEQHIRLPDAIPKLTNHIKKCFNENKKVEDLDLYHLLVQTITFGDNIKDVQCLINIGCPVSPIEDEELSALKLAIDLDRPKSTSALLACGAEIFLRISGYNLLQHTWRSRDVTVFIKMLITRMIEHRIILEKKNIKPGSAIDSIAEDILKNIRTNPDNTFITKEYFSKSDKLKDKSPTDLLCIAVENKCPVLASFIYGAGARAFTHSMEGKTALHHSLDAKTDMEHMLLSHLGASVFVADNKGRKPIDLMQEQQRNQMKMKIAVSELARLDSNLSSAKDNEKRNKIKCLVLLFGCLYVTSGESESILSWRELYSCTLRLLRGSICLDGNEIVKHAEAKQSDDFDIKDDRLTWIKHLCKNTKHLFKHNVSDALQQNMQGSHQELINWLNHLKQNIITLPGGKPKLQLKNREILFEVDNFYDNLKDALEYNCKNNFQLFLHILLTHAHVNPETHLDNLLQTRALHHAAAEGNGTTVAYLLHTCNVENGVTDINGNNAAHYAYIYGHLETGNYIIKIEPKLRDMKNSSGRTPHDMKNAYKDRVKKLKENLLETEKKQKDLSSDNKKELQMKLQCLHETNNGEDLAKIHMELCILRKNIQNVTFKELAKMNLVNYSKGECKTIYLKVLSYIEMIGERISYLNKYLQGKLIPAGSSAEGLRLGAPDESDFNWVLDWTKFVEAILVELPRRQQAWVGYTHNIVVKSQIQDIRYLLEGSNLLSNFHDAVKVAIPDFININDSFLSVILPGVKRTGVGVALTLAWMGEDYKLLLVDVDLVPVIKTARPGGYPHPPLTAKLNTESQTPIHIIEVAGKKWEFYYHDLDCVYINSIGDGSWRFSQTLEESYIMLNLNLDRKNVFLISKYLVNILKEEPWYPQDLQKRYWFFAYKLFKLPAPQGFLLKSSFFKELERVPEDEYWGKSWYSVRVKCIFLQMCRKMWYRDEILETLKPDMHNILEHKVLDSGIVPSYFASSTQRPTAGFLAPTICKILDGLHIDDFV